MPPGRGARSHSGGTPRRAPGADPHPATCRGVADDAASAGLQPGTVVYGDFTAGPAGAARGRPDPRRRRPRCRRRSSVPATSWPSASSPAPTRAGGGRAGSGVGHRLRRAADRRVHPAGPDHGDDVTASPRRGGGPHPPEPASTVSRRRTSTSLRPQRCSESPSSPRRREPARSRRLTAGNGDRHLNVARLKRRPSGSRCYVPLRSETFRLHEEDAMVTTKFRATTRTRTPMVLLTVGLSAALAACSSSSGGAAGGAAPTVGGDVSGRSTCWCPARRGPTRASRRSTRPSPPSPGVQVNFSAVPNEKYHQARASQLTAGSADIGVACPNEIPTTCPPPTPVTTRGWRTPAATSTSPASPSSVGFSTTVLDRTKYKGKNYTVPTGLSYYTGMFYNKKIFEDNGIEVPTTWTELMAACDALKAKGVMPLGIGGKDSAGLNMLGVIQSTYPTADAKNALAKGLYDGSVKLNDGKQLEVLTKLQKLYGYAEPNFAGVTYATMTADFVNGKYAMVADGTGTSRACRRPAAPPSTSATSRCPPATPRPTTRTSGQGRAVARDPRQRQEPQAAVAWLDFFAKNYALFDDQAGFAPRSTAPRATTSTPASPPTSPSSHPPGTPSGSPTPRPARPPPCRSTGRGSPRWAPVTPWRQRPRRRPTGPPD